MVTAMWFFWWDDAVAEAQQLAADTNVRHKVGNDPLGVGWRVELADDAVLLEVCS